jgi:hypothetical protein
VTVTVVGADPSGLASMLADLLEQNLRRDPTRARFLRPSVAVLDAPDADVVVSLRLGGDGVRVGDGDVPDAQLRIRGDAERLLALTTVPLRMGLPDPFTAEGRAVLRDLVARRFVVRGLLRHPVRLARLTSLLSVAEDR